MFAASSLGYCMFTCRIITSATPIVARMSQEFSFMIYTVASTVGAVIVFAIKNINDDDYKYDSSEKKKVKSD